MVLVTSRVGLLIATPSRSTRQGLHRQEHPFFRRYGIILPSSLTRVRSSALVCSTYPPVSVSGTGVGALPRQAFRGRPGVGDLAGPCGLASCSLLGQRLGVAQSPYQLERASSARSPSPPASRLGQTCNSNGAGISTCCPSPTRCRLGLGPTHPLRIDRAAETLDIRRWGFSPHESLLIPTFALVFAPHGLTLMLLCLTTLPYHTHKHACMYPALRRSV